MIKSPRAIQSFYPILVLVSLVYTLFQSGPLNGSWVALILTVLFQLYLPGCLLIRALGRHTTAHPISRFAWTLGAGLGLTIALGGLCRFLWVNVPVYLLVLHVIMLVLSLVKTTPVSTEPRWTLTRQVLPLYGLVVAACFINLYVGAQSWAHFIGFEDQAIFASLSDWLAHNPGEFPNDVPLRSRQIGIINGDTRFDTDGWTYTHGAWIWTSGVTASQLIWFDLNALFVWTAPLLAFALAYEITQRETVGAWSAGLLMLVGLLTLDNLVYYPIYAFGRVGVFQINSLRQFSLTIMMPVSLLAGLVYLRDFRRGDLPLIFIKGVALALLHPFAITMYLLSIGGSAALSWLARRATPRQILPLMLVLVLLLSVPFLQRYARWGLETNTTSPGVSPTENTGFTQLKNVPLIGSVVIRDPQDVFYHPVIVAAAVLGLIAGLYWRRSLAARYIFASTLCLLVVSFTPVVTRIFTNIMSAQGMALFVMILPIPLILALALEMLRETVSRARLVRPFTVAATAAAILVTAAVLLFEPFPIRASARDQLRAYNETQAQRYVNTAQWALITALKDVLPQNEVSTLTVPSAISNLVVEDVSNTLITGGRRSRNTARVADDRFYNRDTIPAPFLDTADIEFLKQYGVTHIVLEAGDSRLPQLLMQPERFEILARPAGYLIFKVQSDLQTSDADDLFAQMNTLYGQMNAPRWDRQDGFALARAGDTTWQTLLNEWETQPTSISTDYGLAMSYLMLGLDAEAIPIWQALHEQYPDTTLFADALAYSLREMGDVENAAAVLQTNLVSDDATVRVLAARSLLTDDFIYMLDSTELRQVLDVAQNDADIWQQLAVFDQPDAQRNRVALLMSVEEWQTAANWLNAIPEVRRAPQDYVAEAGIALVQGDVARALSILQPATEPDWFTAKRVAHPDRWENNVAAQSYYLLKTALAEREGRSVDAEISRREAIGWGAAQTDQPLEPLLTIADYRALYVMNPSMSHNSEDLLTVTATYGNIQPPRISVPIRSWLIQVISPDGAQQYGSVDVPAQFAAGALVRVPVEVEVDLSDVPTLTPALIYIQPRHNNAIVFGEAVLPIVLQRPDAAVIPPDAETVNRQFGETIRLLNYSTQQEQENSSFDITLYWRAEAEIDEDYQVFVHVVGEDGQIAAQRDNQPVNGTYPMRMWRTHTAIADHYTFTEELPPGIYTVRVGLYRLADQKRLTITPNDEQVESDSLNLFTFER